MAELAAAPQARQIVLARFRLLALGERDIAQQTLRAGHLDLVAHLPVEGVAAREPVTRRRHVARGERRVPQAGV
jgi:hypothetical protein